MRKLIAALASLFIVTSAQATTLNTWRYNYVPDTGARQLMQHEISGFSIDATTVGNAEYVGGPDGGTIAIHADNVTDKVVPMDAAVGLLQDASPIAQAGTSAKMVQWGEAPYVRWTPHNMTLHSQEAGDAYWTQDDVTVTDNFAVAPDGTTTAEKLVNGASGTLYQDTATTILSGVVYTQSAYVKSGGAVTWIRAIAAEDNGPGASDSVGVWFNLDTGTVGTTTVYNGATSVGSSITSVGSGWYRISITYSAPATTSMHYITAVTADGGSTRDNDPYYVWGMQLVRGYNANPYLVTTSAARIGIPQAYDPSASKYGVLVEQAATNLAKHSEDFSASTEWDHTGGATLTFDADNTTAPDGSTTADKFTAASGGGSAHGAYQLSLGGSSGDLTVSVYAKDGTAHYASLRAGDDDTLSNSNQWVAASYHLTDCTVDAHDDGSTAITYVSASAVSVGNGWCRLTLTGTNSGAGASTWEYVGVNLAQASATFTNYGDTYFDNDGVTAYFWGYQAEVGLVASSYIPTLGSTVTRAVDVVTVPITSTPVGASPTAASAYWDEKILSKASSASTVLMELGNEATSQEIIEFDSPDASSTRMQIYAGGGAEADIYVFGTRPTVGTEFKGAFSAAANSFNHAINGDADTRDTSGTMPSSLTRFRPASYSDHNVAYQGSAFIYQTILLPRVMDDTELESRTAP